MELTLCELYNDSLAGEDKDMDGRALPACAVADMGDGVEAVESTTGDCSLIITYICTLTESKIRNSPARKGAEAIDGRGSSNGDLPCISCPMRYFFLEDESAGIGQVK